MYTDHTVKNNSGQAALIAILFFLLISLAVTFGFVTLAIREARIANLSFDSKRSFFLAESGQEDAIYRLRKEKKISSQEVINLNGGQVTTDITDVSGNKEILTTGNVQNAIRSLKTILRKGQTIISFQYGTQVGSGGLEMGQSSTIEGAGGTPGSIYSNGPVAGDNGARITGDVTVADSTGSINNIEIGGTVRSHAITLSKICGNAYYTLIDQDSLNFVNSPSSPTCSPPLTPGDTNPNFPDSSSLAMPISDAQIQQFKDDATAGGTINGNCGDSGAPECVIITDATRFFGPKKVVGNLILTKKQTLVVAGTLYFTGSITMDSSSGATIKCDPAFGQDSCVIVTDSWVHLANNAIFQGSGTAGSFLMVMTTLSGCNGGSDTPSCTHHNAALDFHNNAEGAVFYAPNSMVNLHNGVHLTEITANKIRLDNNAVVTYDQSLANAKFSAGSSGKWRIQSWQEVE